MSFLWMSLFALGIVAVDQFTKFVVLENIALYEKVPFLPGFIGFTYVQNTGGAWSMFSGMMWLFVAVFAVLTVLIVVEYFWKRMPFTGFERWCIAAVYGGGLGNMIDRVRLGYVVDMIETEFITFPIFNVADCFITCGCIALIASLIFFNKAFWKDEKK